VLRDRLAAMVTAADAKGFRTPTGRFVGIAMPGKVQYRALVDDLLYRLKADDALRLELSTKYSGPKQLQWRTFQQKEKP
jgi:hypothetical protein